MDREYIKKLIPVYLDGELDPQERQEVETALKADPELRAELDAYKETWKMLGDWSEIEPEPGYQSRFWTELASRRSWWKEALSNVQHAFSQPRLAPAFVAAAVVIVVGFFSLVNYIQMKSPEMMMASTSVEELEVIESMELVASEDFELIENIELAENLELLEDLEFFEDLDILEDWDGQET